jgi:hypothetical protein
MYLLVLVVSFTFSFFYCFQHAVMAGDKKPKRHLRFAWETRDYVGHVEFR